MKILVLGSAAGGGFPQWNCHCFNCAGVRDGSINAKPRTQSSIAISQDGERWILINASPDIRAQLAQNPELRSPQKKRGSAIEAIFLVDAQIDHSSGLLFLREGEPLNVYCTKSVHDDLSTGLPLFNVLNYFCGVNYTELKLDSSMIVEAAPNLEFAIIPIEGKAPPYSPHRNDPHPGDNIALLIKDNRTQKKLFYSPGLATIDSHVMSLLKQADCILVDGTFWTEDEMITQKLGVKTASEMGHLPQSGDDGMITVLNKVKDARKVLIHINNSNPILDEDSRARQVLNDAGIEVAYDGMQIDLLS